MANIQLDYTDIIDIFKEKLCVDNIVKKISTIFLNNRFSSNVDYKPYFQRNYVWDDEKATYFIESILLGTEIPPLVLFQTDEKNEVIDGRQRYETIERFLKDKFALNKNGLHVLTKLEGLKYSQLDPEIKEKFEETRIRILQFKVVNEPKLEIERQDKIKKEIFRRYNSGITSLQKEEIERAAYIDDDISNYFYNEINNDVSLYNFLCDIILPKSKAKAIKRDKLNIILTRIRTLLVLPYIPIYTYAAISSKLELVHRCYSKHIAEKDCGAAFLNFSNVVEILKSFNEKCSELKSSLLNNKLFFETLFWAVSILLNNGYSISEDNVNAIMQTIHNSDNEELWKSIGEEFRDYELIFEQTGSHYYSAINRRYNFISNAIMIVIPFDFSRYLKDNERHKQIVKGSTAIEEIESYQLNKPLPETLTIEDIMSDMGKSKFLIRPSYQRSEIKNVQKASYLMESILLGINIPPIFVYKRKDKVKEVIDGQQRLLTILGFLDNSYTDENGNNAFSNKNRFKLTKLKILEELNGINIDNLKETFINKIYEFPIDVIEIDSKINPEFNPIDLFLRLNSKPYPIKENTFEMWNAYIDKDIVSAIKRLAKDNEGKVFRNKDTRMKVEELITSLAYLEYRMAQENTEIINILNIYKKNNRICSRIMSKDNVTKTLSFVSNNNPNSFIEAINNVEKYIEKINILIDNDVVNLRKLLSHNKNGVQYKTDQNYYFLWCVLKNIDTQQLKENKHSYFEKISEFFAMIQKAPDSYTIPEFLKQIEEFATIL